MAIAVGTGHRADKGGLSSIFRPAYSRRARFRLTDCLVARNPQIFQMPRWNAVFSEHARAGLGNALWTFLPSVPRLMSHNSTLPCLRTTLVIMPEGIEYNLQSLKERCSVRPSSQPLDWTTGSTSVHTSFVTPWTASLDV